MKIEYITTEGCCYECGREYQTAKGKRFNPITRTMDANDNAVKITIGENLTRMNSIGIQITLCATCYRELLWKIDVCQQCLADICENVY